MTKFKKALIAVVALVASFGVAQVTSAPSASAYLSPCYASGSNNNAVVAWCLGTAPTGGLNQVRAKATCWGYNIITTYGSWVPVKVNSVATCPAGYVLNSNADISYQLR